MLHPAWAYFARAFGVEQVSVEVEGKEPTARQLAALVERAKADGARVVFGEPQTSGTAAAALARQIGARVLLLAPLSAHYIGALARSSEEIAAALSPPP